LPESQLRRRAMLGWGLAGNAILEAICTAQPAIVLIASLSAV